MKILATDKNHNIRKLLKRELAPSGHHIVLAGTPLEMTEMLKRDPGFDLIILDPDQFFGTDTELFTAIRGQNRCRVIIHGFEQALIIPPEITHIFIGKSDTSIDTIKTYINQDLRSDEH